MVPNAPREFTDSEPSDLNVNFVGVPGEIVKTFDSADSRTICAPPATGSAVPVNCKRNVPDFTKPGFAQV